MAKVKAILFFFDPLTEKCLTSTNIDLNLNFVEYKSQSQISGNS